MVYYKKQRFVNMACSKSAKVKEPRFVSMVRYKKVKESRFVNLVCYKKYRFVNMVCYKKRRSKRTTVC